MTAPNQKKPGFFSILSQTTPSQKILIFFLTIIFSCSGMVSISVAVFFKEPLIICTDPITNSSFHCSEVTACTYNYEYVIDKENGPKSFSSQYDLICEGSAEKRLALTCLFIGYLLAAIVQLVYFIDATRRKKFIILGGYALAVSYFLMLVVSWANLSFRMIALLFFVAGLGTVYIITYSYIYVSEAFKGELTSMLIIVLNLGWGIIGIIFTLIGYLFNCDWRVLMGSCSVFVCCSCLYMSFSKEKSKQSIEDKGNDQPIEEEDEDDEPVGEPISIFSYFKDMWPHKTIRTNFLIYCLTWSFCNMIYVLQYVELGSVGGSVYFNSIFLCCIELFSNFFAGIMIKKYSCDKILNIVISMVIIFFLCFVRAPLSIGDASGLEIAFYITCLLITKLSNDLIDLMVYLNLPKMFTDKYVGFFLIVSRFFCRILLIFLPTINHLVRKLHYHPFVFYGLCYAVCRFLLTWCKEVQPDAGIDELMNDVNIGNLERTAILSATHSMAGSLVHDQILRKIKVDGVKLSVIKQYKAHPEDLKLGSAVLKLSSKILQSIHCSKSMHHKVHQVELKENLLQKPEN